MAYNPKEDPSEMNHKSDAILFLEEEKNPFFSLVFYLYIFKEQASLIARPISDVWRMRFFRVLGGGGGTNFDSRFDVKPKKNPTAFQLENSFMQLLPWPLKISSNRRGGGKLHQVPRFVKRTQMNIRHKGSTKIASMLYIFSPKKIPLDLTAVRKKMWKLLSNWSRNLYRKYLSKLRHIPK